MPSSLLALTMAGRPKAFDPDAALDRALDLFWQNGYEATGVEALLEAMQIGRQSLYNTFGSKRALYEKTLRRYDQWRLQQVRTLLHAPGSPLANVVGLVRLWGALASEPDQPFRGCFLHNSAIELGPHEPEWAEISHDHLLALEEQFADALERAQVAGELSMSVSVRIQARAIVATFQGLLALGKSRMDPAFIQDVVDAALAPLEG